VYPNNAVMVQNPHMINKPPMVESVVANDKPTMCMNQNVACTFLDTQYNGKLNQTWKTCINMNGINNHILYITPNNVVIKSIETAQIPEFVVNLNGQQTTCKIMIEDKYVAGFLYICGDWYVMMRLFGSTLNTEYFARTEANKVFYKLSNIKVDLNIENPNSEGTSIITIPEGSYELIDKTPFFALSNTPIVNIKTGFQNIIKASLIRGKSVFNVLQRFRQQKLFAHNEKEEIAKDVFSWLFGIDQ
jgi:hypothetical protein